MLGFLEASGNTSVLQDLTDAADEGLLHVALARQHVPLTQRLLGMVSARAAVGGTCWEAHCPASTRLA